MHELVTVRLEARAMRNLPVHFRREEEVRRSRIDPLGDGLFGRQAIPDTVQFDCVVTRRVIAEKLVLFEGGRIEPARTLPGFIRIAGKPDVRLRHTSCPL
jgi:hypothetical protein